MAADPLTAQTIDELLLADANFDSDDDFLGNDTKKAAERDDKATLSPRKRKAVDDFDDLRNDVDEEVKIVKQRKKIPKLDAERLLSEPGIPKIRTSIRSGQWKRKLRLKGKGHEFSDVAKLLNYYQLWLDQLYPRAKFADAIEMVEKAGHTKKMQMYRKSWIDEGKPGFMRREEIDEAMDANTGAQVTRNEGLEEQQDQPPQEENVAALFFGMEDQGYSNGVDGPDDDELEALMAQEADPPMRPKPRRSTEESEGEDDLDALLAQEDNRRANNRTETGITDELDALLDAENSNQTSAAKDDPDVENLTDEDDQLDALRNEDSQPVDGVPHNPQTSANLLREDSDELDAILMARDPHAAEVDLPSLPTITTLASELARGRKSQNATSEDVPELDNTISSSPIPNVRTDELDDLLDEHEAAMRHQHADKENLTTVVSSSPIPNDI